MDKDGGKWGRNRAEQGGSGWEAAWLKDALLSLRLFRGGAGY